MTFLLILAFVLFGAGLLGLLVLPQAQISPNPITGSHRYMKLHP